MMKFGEYKDKFDRDGFVIVEQFLPADEFAELNENLGRYIREVVPTLPDANAFYQDKSRLETLKQMQHMGGDPFFRDYVQHPHWTGLAETLLSEPVNPQEPEWFNKPPGTDHPTPPHQDNYYFCLKPANVLTMWLALDPVDEENGCLRYVPGSHRRGIRPHARSDVLGFSQGITDFGSQDETAEMPICLQPNDLAVHHGEMIHRAEPNRTTTRNRRGFAIVMQGKSCRRDAAAFERYLADKNKQHEAQGLQTS